MKKLILNKSVIIFAIYFSLIGCIPPKVIITPDKLPDAVIGTPYYTEIKITGGSGPISGSGFKLHIYPDNSGLEIIFPEINGRVKYNNMTIQGIPKTVENVTIIIKGGMIPSGWRATSDFEKTYVIKVKEAE